MTAGAVSQSYSFLQISSKTKISSAGIEVVNLIKNLARQQRSSALAQLASRLSAVIRYGAGSGDDPFAKVKGLITDMIDKLMKEAEAEASEKAYCEEELEDDIEKLTGKIDSATAASERLKEEVKGLQKALADLAEEQAEMDKIREETHEAYVAAKK